MQKLITLVVLLFITYLASAGLQTCHSTGDPHYKNFFGKTFNVYGIQGDFNLVKSARGNFQVQTRVQYGQWWANRAINSAISIISDGNKLVHFGDHYYINGVKNGALNFKNGASVKKINSRRFEVKSKTGEVVVFDYFSANAKKANFAKFYFNIYVSAPSNQKYSGLCSWKGGVFNAFLVKGGDAFNRFHVLRTKIIKIKTKRVKWVSRVIKLRAIRYCKVTLRLRGNLLRDCLSDIREARGDLRAARGYATANKDIKEIKIRRINRRAAFKKCARSCPCLRKPKKTKVRVVTKCKRIKPKKRKVRVVTKCKRIKPKKRKVRVVTKCKRIRRRL